MLWLFLSFFTLSLQLRSSTAQSDASCLPFYNWTFNSHKQSPCQVASSLLSVCNNGPFPVNALPDSTHYLGPTLQNANPCQCNSVTYSLMSACGACQGRTYLSWSVWTANCANVSVSIYPEPIPSGVAVPGWAYLDVEANDTFDQILARQDANLTESTAIPSPTSSIIKSTTVSSPKASSTTTSSSATAPSSSTTSGGDTVNQTAITKHDNAIGGGIVGGLAGLFLLCGLLYWYLHRRRRIRRNGQPLPSPSPTDPENPSWHGEGPYMAQVGDNGISGTAAPSVTSSLPPASATQDVPSTTSSIASARITHP